MRFAWVMMLVSLALQQEGTEKPPPRYGIEVLDSTYPQKTPDEGLKSAVKAIQEQRISYLLAQLADPEFVDKKVLEYKKQFDGKEEGRTLLAFDRLIKETTQHLQRDPVLLQELRRFAKEGDWKETPTGAVASVKDIPGRQVFMRKVQNRWYLQDKQK